MILQAFRMVSMILSISATLLACASLKGSSHANFRVVERSRQEKPEWAQSAQAGKSVAVRPWQFGQDPFEYVVSKDKILDITLGLDQAYELALTNTRLQVRNFLKDYWQQRGTLGPLVAEDLELLEAKLHQVAEKQVNDSLIQDIYYEKIAVDAAKEPFPLSYTVFVHVKMGQVQMYELMREVQKACQESPRPQLQQLAQNRQAFPADL